MLTTKKIIGIKTEGTPGSAETLAATDFFLAYDVEVSPDVELNERKYGSTSLDPYSQLPGKLFQDVKFKTDLKHSAGASPLTPLIALLNAAGLDNTSNANIFLPITIPDTGHNPGHHATIKTYEDGILKVVAGCMLNAKFIFEVGKIPSIEFSGKGIYAAVTDAAFPTNTPNTTNPWTVKNCSFTVGSYAAIISKLEIDLGCEIAERPSINAPQGILGFAITGFKPSGSCDPEAVLVATHDFYTRLAAGTIGALSLTMTNADSSQTIVLSLPKVQYGKIGQADRSGIMTFNVPLIFSRNAGNDWISLTFTYTP